MVIEQESRKYIHINCETISVKRFLMAGGSIHTLSKILGHSNVEVTEKAYLDLSYADLKSSYERFSPLANLKKR